MMWNPFAWLPAHRAKVYRTLIVQQNCSSEFGASEAALMAGQRRLPA
jgi:hypothetical protein